MFNGDYNNLTNKPVLFSGNYNDLTNKPTIPTVPTKVSAFTNDSGFITEAPMTVNNMLVKVIHGLKYKQVVVMMLLTRTLLLFTLMQTLLQLLKLTLCGIN